MNKFIATAAAACLALSGAAHASPISVSVFDLNAFKSAVDYVNFDVQDFEDSSAFTMSTTLGGAASALTITDGANSGGQVEEAFLNTNVGSFTSNGGTGVGGVCNESGGDCTNLYLKNTTSYGQTSLVATGDNYGDSPGDWSLNANDTLGIIWEVGRAGGSLFNRVVLAVTDLTDTGAKVTITGAGDTYELDPKSLINGAGSLIVIDFATLVSSATVSIANSKIGDSFSIDGASVGVVPLPAGGLLLLTGFGALALRRRRKAA